MEVVKQALQGIQDEQLQVRSGQPVRPSQQTTTPAGTARQILQPPATRPARRGISRRVVIVGLAGLAISGITWAWVSQSPQGSQIIQSSQDPHLLYTYSGHSGPVDAVVWSPDGKRIASGSVDKTVQVWDAAGAMTRRCRSGMHRDDFRQLGMVSIFSSAFTQLSGWYLCGTTP